MLRTTRIMCAGGQFALLREGRIGGNRTCQRRPVLAILAAGGLRRRRRRRNRDISYTAAYCIEGERHRGSPLQQGRRCRWARHWRAPRHHVTCGLARHEGSALFKQSLVTCMDDALPVRATYVTLLESRDGSQACS